MHRDEKDAATNRMRERRLIYKGGRADRLLVVKRKRIKGGT